MSWGPSRTSCLAPCAVAFDATTTTASSTTLPFHELAYQWNFGDAGSGSWGDKPTGTAGAGARRSRNIDYGPLAAHVFDNPGSYSVCLQVSNATGTTTANCQTITVSAWPTDATTVCVNTAGDADFSACPVNAGHQNTNTYESALSYLTGSVKRLLLKGGSTFTTSTGGNAAVSSGPGMVGTYGSGRATVQLTAAYAGLGVGSSDFRLSNITIDCNSNPTWGVLSPSVQANILVYQTRLTRCNDNIVPAGDTNLLFIVDSDVTNAVAVPTWGHGMYITGKFAVLGTSVDGNGVTAHPFRSMFANGAIVAHSYFGNPNPAVEAFTLRNDATGSTPTQRVVIADNLIEGTGWATVNLSGYASPAIGVVRDVIFEANWVRGKAGTAGGAGIVNRQSSYMTYRNNFLDHTNDSGPDGGDLGIDDATAGTSSSNVWFYNNTGYSPKTGSYTGVSIGAGASVVVKNNLWYGPATSLQIPVSGSATTANNSTAAQIKNSNPNFTSTTPFNPANAKILSGSYAIGTATSIPVWLDAFGATASGDIGARTH